MPLIAYTTGTSTETNVSALYDSADRKNWFYQPNFVRRRHKNHGPRESFKINQEIIQTRYDMQVLYKRLGIAEDKLSSVVGQFSDGGQVDEITLTPIFSGDPQDMILVGIAELGASIDNVRERVKRLEG